MANESITNTNATARRASSCLRATCVEIAVVCGIATNICCFSTARDLRKAGFQVWMVEDASAGIDIPIAGLFQAKAKQEGVELGIRYVSVAEVKKAWTK